MRFCFSSKVVALLAALILPVALRAVTENPVVRLHGRDLTFLLTFDDGTAQPDVGLVENLKHKRFETMEKGFLGRAMSAGSLRFPHPAGSRAVDMTRPGTLVMWVQMRRSPKPDKAEPSQSFVVWDMGRDKTMVLMKQGAMRWGEGIMSLHYTGGGKGMRFVKSVSVPAPVTMWKPGAWRMLVATWTPEKIGISLDGEPVKELVYDRKFGPFTGAFEINNGRLDVPDAERVFAVDEIAVLSRRLSDAEIRMLYAKTKDRGI